MILATLVTVLIDGTFVNGSVPATLRGGIVVAPVAPYVTRIAERIERSDGRFEFARGSRSIRVAIGSPFAWNGSSVQPLPIAPYVRSGEAIIPLAAIARALGAEVEYDPSTHSLRIELRPEPLATMTPSPPREPGPQAPVTFAPTAVPTPAPIVTGVPKPRRTPVVVEGSGG